MELDMETWCALNCCINFESSLKKEKKIKLEIWVNISYLIRKEPNKGNISWVTFLDLIKLQFMMIKFGHEFIPPFFLFCPERALSDGRTYESLKACNVFWTIHSSIERIISLWGSLHTLYNLSLSPTAHSTIKHNSLMSIQVRPQYSWGVYSWTSHETKTCG